MTTHRITNADDVRSGNAVSPDRSLLGVPMKNLVQESFAPAAAVATGVAAAQAVAGAGNLTINGSLATGGVATFDVPRTATIVSANAGDTTQTATFTGTDVFGVALHQTVTLNGTATVATKKAFKTITQVAISAATAGNISSGSGTGIGLTYAVADGGFVQGKLGQNTADAGTFTVPDQTNPATALTGDVRGTYAPAGALNGTNKYTVTYVALNGPAQANGFGVTQF